MRTSKDPIKLRRRKLKNGNVSLYLDLCIDNRREYEFLKLYLVPERTKADRDKNKETLALAETIKAQRIVELRNARFGLQDTRTKGVLLQPVIGQLESKGDSYLGIARRIQSATTERMTTEQITPAWVRRVCKSVTDDKTLKQSSKHTYLIQFKFFLNRLAKAHLISIDALEAWQGTDNEQAIREFLTAEELVTLIRTPHKQDTIRRMFLFSCFCGLRLSDCMNLTWGQVEDSDDGSRIVFRQKKTKQLEYFDINSDARSYMGERGAVSQSVFGRYHRNTIGNAIRDWVSDAGISKHITFHCARHTFATLLISADTNLFVVSKLLGHRNIKTTEIYAKVVDNIKRDAVNALSKLVSEASHEKVTESEQQISTDDDKNTP